MGGKRQETWLRDMAWRTVAITLPGTVSLGLAGQEDMGTHSGHSPGPVFCSR